jgi:protein SMG8
MIGQRTGPMCRKYLAELQRECNQIWTSGRQMCPAVSLRGNPCLSPLHQLSSVQHGSGIKFVSTCDCGKKQSTREDPFDVTEANRTFYSRLVDICCKRCEFFNLPSAPLIPSSSSSTSLSQNQQLSGKSRESREAEHFTGLKASGDSSHHEPSEAMFSEAVPGGMSLEYFREDLSQRSDDSAAALELVGLNRPHGKSGFNFWRRIMKSIR